MSQRAKPKCDILQSMQDSVILRLRSG